jgi:hypothetical protein
MSNDVTVADLKEFDRYVAKWQVLLNLSDWRIERAHRRSKAMAEVSFNDEARLATYRVGTTFGAEEVTPDSLERTALHELLHILLHDLSTEWTDANEHRVINLMEKLLMKRATHEAT